MDSITHIFKSPILIANKISPPPPPQDLDIGLLPKLCSRSRLYAVFTNKCTTVTFLDKKATKHSVKKVDLSNSSSSSQTKSKEDENLFARLEELERQEQMNKELENEQYFVDSFSCNTNSNDESTENDTHNTSRAGSTKNASSNSSTCTNKEPDRKSRTLKEQNNSSRAETCSFEDERATRACTTQSEQNDVGDTCSIRKAKSSDESEKKRLVKKVSWKESIVEKQEGDTVPYPKDENATIYFTHSTGMVRLKAVCHCRFF